MGDNLMDTIGRGETWRFFMGVIQYLDSSLSFVTMDELQVAMSSHSTKFDPDLVVQMAAAGNIDCYQAQTAQGEVVQYFCSVKFKPMRPMM